MHVSVSSPTFHIQAIAKCFTSTYALLMELRHHVLVIFSIKLLIETIKIIFMVIALYYLTQHLIFITQSSLCNDHHHQHNDTIIYRECLEHNLLISTITLIYWGGDNQKNVTHTSPCLYVQTRWSGVETEGAPVWPENRLLSLGILT